MKKSSSIPFVPNAITAFGLTCGLFIIFKVNMVDPGEGTYQSQLVTAGLLMLAAVADVLDGAVARVMKAESVFGGFFDSLADAITFGVAPSVIVLKSLSMVPGTELSLAATTGATLFTLCGVLRLVRFNVKSVESQGNTEGEISAKRNFTGLPIPAGAAALVSANLFLVSPMMEQWFLPSDEMRTLIMAPAMAVLGYLMVSRWRYPSIKTLQIKVSSFKLVFFVVVTAVMVFYGLLHHFAALFVIVAWGYVLLGLGLSLVRLASGRRIRALRDFQPKSPEEE